MTDRLKELEDLIRITCETVTYNTTTLAHLTERIEHLEVTLLNTAKRKLDCSMRD